MQLYAPCCYLTSVTKRCQYQLQSDHESTHQQERMRFSPMHTTSNCAMSNNQFAILLYQEILNIHMPQICKGSNQEGSAHFAILVCCQTNCKDCEARKRWRHTLTPIHRSSKMHSVKLHCRLESSLCDIFATL